MPAHHSTKLTILFLATLMIQGLAYHFISSYKTAEIHQVLTAKVQRNQAKLEAGTHSLHLVSEMVFRQIIDTPEVTGLFASAMGKTAEEQAVIRNQLYSRLKNVYQQLRASGIKQLHFHTKDNHSFLRFHRPQKFGDDLTHVRYSVRIANSTQHIMEGFEEGRIFNGFRYVFPLFHEQAHIGTVEASFSAATLQHQFEKQGVQATDFVVSKPIILEKVFNTELSNYVNSEISPIWMTEQNLFSYTPQDILRRKKLERMMRDEAAPAMELGKAFALYRALDQKIYTVTFLPIHNLEGKLAAYYLLYEPCSVIPRILGTTSKQLVIAMTLLQAVLILLYFLVVSHFKIRHKNRCLAEQATALAISSEQSLAASKAKSAFLANMSHEIRTPLNAVIGFSNLLSATKLNVKQRDFTKMINVSAKALLEIINDILDFSKIEAGKLDLVTDEESLEDIVSQAVDIVKHPVSVKGIKFYLDIPLPLPERVIGDALRIKQILINLLNNAVKFTNEGSVTLRVTYQTEGASHGLFKFEVSDTGIGISDEQKEKLFQSFNQADPSTARRFGGTGLGLTISMLLSQKMNGDLTVESTPNLGSCFTLSLPLPIVTPASTSPLSLQTALVYTPSTAEKNFISQPLQHLGFSLQYVDQLTTLLPTIEELSPDLVVIDCEPTDEALIKHLNLLKTLASAEQATDLLLLHPPIYEEKLYAAYRNLDFGHFLSKPLKRQELREALEEANPNATHTKNTPCTLNLSFTVLVAEDVSYNMKLVKLMLSKVFPKVTVIEAENGQSALDLIAEHPIDLVLMDVQMPEMDGFTALNHIRQSQQTYATVPIIMLTAGVSMDEKDRALELGANNFLTKPIEIKQLTETILPYLS